LIASLKNNQSRCAARRKSADRNLTWPKVVRLQPSREKFSLPTLDGTATVTLKAKLMMPDMGLPDAVAWNKSRSHNRQNYLKGRSILPLWRKLPARKFDAVLRPKRFDFFPKVRRK
jgi:hypothetical protein